MKTLTALLSFAYLLSGVAHAKEKIREVFVSSTQVADVSTSIGFATLIDFEEKPTSVVLGDQESFRVEYLDQALAVKPLRAGASSNLYVFSDSGRYSIRLREERGHGDADYVVKIKSKRPEEPRKSVDTKWKTVERKASLGNLSFRLRRVGVQSGAIVLLDVDISSVRQTSIDPGVFWLRQAAAVPINRLFLSSLEVGANHSAKAIIEIDRSDLKRNSGLTLELRVKGKLRRLLIPKEALWM